MLPLPPGAPIATCNNTSSYSSRRYRKVCVARCIPSQASLSTTTAPAHQHVVSAGVQCATELRIRSNDRRALATPNSFQQQGSGKANTVQKAGPNSAASAAVVAPTETANTAAEPYKRSVTHGGLQRLKDGMPRCHTRSKKHQHQPVQPVHHGTTKLLEPQTNQQQSSTVDTCTSPSGQEQTMCHAATEYHKQVARSLRNCSSFQQLRKIVQQHGPQMDVISVTSCFSVAVGLAKQQMQQQQQQQFNAGRLQQTPNNQPVDQQQQHRAEHCDTPSPHHKQQHLHQRQQQQQPQMPAGATRQAEQQEQQQRSSSNSDVQALLHLQLVPLLQRKLHQLDAVGLVVVLRSLAVLGYANEALLADLEQAAVRLANQLSPRLLSQMVWCFGQLSSCPQQQLMRRLLLHSAGQLQQKRWNSQDCAQMLHGLAQLQQRPPQPWLNVYYAQVQQLLVEKQLHPTALCIILHSSAKLDCQLPRELLQQLLDEAELALPSLPPAGLGMLSHALLLLKRDPSSSWQQRYLEAAWGVIVNHSDARNLPLLAVPLLRWRCLPPKSWMEGFLQACSGQLRDMQAQGIAVLGHSIAGLRILPPKPWLLQYFVAADSKALASTPAGCSYLIHTVAAWRCLEVSSSSSSRSTGQLAVVPVGPASPASGSQTRNTAYAALTPAAIAGDCKPVEDGQPRMAAAAGCAANDARQQLQQAHQLQLQQLQADLVNQCIQCFLSHGKSFTAEQVGMFCRGLAQFGVQQNVQLSQQLHDVTCSLLKQRSFKLTAATLTNILLAVAMCCPDAAMPQLMQLVWWRLQQLLQTVTPAHAAAIAWGASCLQGSLQDRTQDGNSHSRSRASSTGRCNSKVGSVDSSRNSSVQPSELFTQQLMQRVALTVDDASLQQLSVLLLQARKARWQLDSSVVQFLVVELLRKQSSALKKCTCGSRESGSSTATSGGPSSTGSTAHISSGSSSNSSSQVESMLFGSANHRLKPCLHATAAVAAWADVLEPGSRMAALRLCEMIQLVGQLQDSSAHSLLAGSVRALSTGRSSVSCEQLS